MESTAPGEAVEQLTEERPLACNENAREVLGACPALCVLGATGRLGSEICLQALECGFEVYALVRSLQRAKQLFGTTTHPKLHMTEGNPMDAVQLIPLIEKCIVVFNCIGPRNYAEATDEVSASTKAVVEAMRKKNSSTPNRYIMTGGITLMKRPQAQNRRWCDEPGIVPPHLKKPTDDMCAAVDYLRSCSLMEYVVMTPGRFIPGKGSRQVVQFVNETMYADKWRSRVFIGDLAATMLQMATRKFPVSGSMVGVESSDAMTLELEESEAFKLAVAEVK